MDDATASDNYGEVTIEVSTRPGWRCCGQLHHRSRSTATTTRKQLFGHQTITVQGLTP